MTTKKRKEWIRAISSVPIVKTGLSLMTNTVVTALLGLAFWVVAARLFTEAQVGLSTAVIVTMMLLADVSCLGLRTGIARFLPAAGDRRVGLLRLTYGVPLIVAMAGAVLYLIGLKWFAPELVELRDGRGLPLFFVMSTALWSTFILQDSVLMALRKGPWIPTENALFGVAKIALLFAFAGTVTDYGIFLAWALPIVPIVIGTNLLIAQTVRRQADADTRVKKREIEVPNESSLFEPTANKLLRFSFSDWVSSIGRLVPLLVLPYLILSQEGKAAAGFYQIAWSIAFTLFALGSGVAEAVLAEASYDVDSLRYNMRRAAALALSVTVPAVALVVTAAPLLASGFGPSYQENSTHLIRILVPAAIPNIVLQLLLSRLRAQGRMRRVIAAEATLSGSVLALAIVLMPRFGVDGVAWAWLGAITIFALIGTVMHLYRSRDASTAFNEKSEVVRLAGMAQ